MDGHFARCWQELAAIDQDDLLVFAETSVALAHADGLVPGWNDETN